MERAYNNRTRSSLKLWQEASKIIAGGVTANVKFFEPYPIFMKKAKGSKLYDVDRNEYIDYCLCFGPLILGHGHPKVVEAIRKQIEEGGTTIYGTPHELEVRMAEKIKKHVPCAKMVRFTNSGLEATLHTIRLARAYTRREKVAKFEGHYHGAHDYVLVSMMPPMETAGPANAPNAVPDSAGLPRFILDNTIVLPFNNLDATEEIIREHKDELAAVILEPVARGFLPPEVEFLRGLREITEKHGIVLIFDEVMTGFRFGLSCAQGYFDVIPDLTALGKILGGGLPAGAFAGRRDLMELVSPVGVKKPWERLFHSGTYNGCPVALAAGLATIEVLEQDGAYDHINWVAEKVKERIRDSFERYGVDVQLVGACSMFQPIFTSKEVRNYRDVARSDSKKRINFDIELVNQGIYVRPNKTYYTSLAHTKDDVDKTLNVVENAAKVLAT